MNTDSSIIGTHSLRMNLAHTYENTSLKMKRKTDSDNGEHSIVPHILPRGYRAVNKRGTIHTTLRLRETSVPKKPGRHVHRERAFYRAIVPDNTVRFPR